jgi:uncharacterized repeat protein (TIGR01451 family)
MQLAGASSENNNSMTVQVSDAVTTTTLISTTSGIYGWEHQWRYLDEWVGKEITLTFAVHQAAYAPPVFALLDEVTLGSVYPDLWLDTDAAAHNLRPGELVTLTLAPGNRGSVLASGVQISLTLPAGLEFISASLEPSAAPPVLHFDLGDIGPPPRRWIWRATTWSSSCAWTPASICSFRCCTIELHFGDAGLLIYALPPHQFHKQS